MRASADTALPPVAPLAALLLTLGLPALAGDVTGTVKVADQADAERTIVFIESVPEERFTRPTGLQRLSQKGARFRPAVLPVVRGTQVDMSNDDWVAHNVFSKSGPKSFDLGLYGKEDRKVVTFDKEGVVEVFCSIHPRMSAVILVLQNPFFARPAPDGTFTIPAVPAGRYQLRVYRPRAPGQKTVVKVPAAGRVAVAL